MMEKPDGPLRRAGCERGLTYFAPAVARLMIRLILALLTRKNHGKNVVQIIAPI